MGFRVGHALAAGAALLLSLTSPAAAQVPDPYARELAHQLAEAETAPGHSGYMRVAGPFASALPARMNHRIQVTLRAGQEYRVVGVCDARCGAIDLRVLDPDDQVLAENALNGRTAVTSVRPSYTGPHTIEVVMLRCAGSPCYFAFNVYAR